MLTYLVHPLLVGKWLSIDFLLDRKWNDGLLHPEERNTIQRLYKKRKEKNGSVQINTSRNFVGHCNDHQLNIVHYLHVRVV